MYRYEQHCLARAAGVLTEPCTVVVNELVVEEVNQPRDERYRLTEAGRGLRRVVGQLGRWGRLRLAPPGLRDLDAGVGRDASGETA